MGYCYKCGAPLGGNYRNCPFCGAEFDDTNGAFDGRAAAGSGAVVPRRAVPSSAKPSAKPVKRNRTALFALGGALLGVAVVAALLVAGGLPGGASSSGGAAGASGQVVSGGAQDGESASSGADVDEAQAAADDRAELEDRAMEFTRDFFDAADLGEPVNGFYKNMINVEGWEERCLAHTDRNPTITEKILSWHAGAWTTFEGAEVVSVDPSANTVTLHVKSFGGNGSLPVERVQNNSYDEEDFTVTFDEDNNVIAYETSNYVSGSGH